MSDRTVTLSTFCEIVGMSVSRFRSLRQRDQLPMVWLEEWDAPEEEAYGGWTRFTPRDALATRCAIELADNNGLSFPDASTIVSSSAGASAFLQDGASASDYWLGAVEFRGVEGDGGPDWRHRGHWRGALGDLAPWMSRRDDDKPARVILCNVVNAWAVLQPRAATVGYDLTPDAFTARKR